MSFLSRKVNSKARKFKVSVVAHNVINVLTSFSFCSAILSTVFHPQGHFMVTR